MTPPGRDPAPRYGCLYRLIRAAAICAGLVAVATISGYVAMIWFLEADKMEVPRHRADSVAAGGLIGRPRPGRWARIQHRHPQGHVARQRPSRHALSWRRGATIVIEDPIRSRPRPSGDRRRRAGPGGGLVFGP
jgi:hypothetical protein